MVTYSASDRLDRCMLRQTVHTHTRFLSQYFECVCVCYLLLYFESIRANQMCSVRL